MHEVVDSIFALSSFIETNRVRTDLFLVRNNIHSPAILSL